MAKRGVKAAQGRKSSGHFFAKELEGEKPPSRATMEALCAHAREFHGYEIWDTLTEGMLTIVDSPSGETCYCSVMGMRGEVRALQVYLGAEGLEFFHDVSAGIIANLGDFYGLQRSVAVHYSPLREAEKCEREMFQMLNYAPLKGLFPRFHALRPGYLPWVPNAEEAELLLHCLRAMCAFCPRIAANSLSDYWGDSLTYPKLVPAGEGGGWSIEREAGREAVASTPPPAPVDPKKVANVLAFAETSAMVVEVDCFFGSTPIGVGAKRKMLPRMSLAVDSMSGFVFPPDLQEPNASPGESLERVVFTMIESAGALPRQIRVADENYKAALTPLANALGISLKLTPRLPALERAKSALLEAFGSPGRLSRHR